MITTPKSKDHSKVQSKVQCPVFFVHGTLDNVVQHSNSEALFDASIFDFPPLFVEAGHKDIESKFQNLLFRF